MQPCVQRTTQPFWDFEQTVDLPVTDELIEYLAGNGDAVIQVRLIRTSTIHLQSVHDFLATATHSWF